MRVCLTHSSRTPSLYTFHSEDLKEREKERSEGLLLYSAQFELRRDKNDSSFLRKHRCAGLL